VKAIEKAEKAAEQSGQGDVAAALREVRKAYRLDDTAAPAAEDAA
jgi:hypothetical protein